MANVELKTDFKDGEKLYGPELNNNFKAIKAALEAMNKIVWQDDQEIPDSITAFRGTTEELMNREIIDGQLLYDTNTGETYIDYEGRRISTGSGNAIHIGEDEPTNPSTQLWIPTDEFTSVGTEVVNSLEGNETAKAPSVDAVKKSLENIENKLIDTGWVSPDLNEGWSDSYNTSPTRYRKIGKFVFLESFVDATVDAVNTIFTLPEGFRPSSQYTRYPVYTNKGVMFINITADGAIQLMDKNSAVDWVSINYSFIAD